MKGLLLALGGGGIRGFFHVGVLRILREHNIPLSGIAGSSAGALAAASYAFGLELHPDALAEKILDPDLASLTKVSGGPLGIAQAGTLLFRAMRRPALASQGKIAQGLKTLFGDRRIEEASVPLAIVAADLLTGALVVFRQGPLVPALLASSAIPGIFPPVEIDGRYLVDGDIAEKVPVSAARMLGRGRVLAIDVSNPAPTEPPQSSLDTVLQSGEASRMRLKDLALKSADMVLRLPITTPIDTFDQDQIPFVYELGMETARAHLSEIRALLSPWRRILGGWRQKPHPGE